MNTKRIGAIAGALLVALGAAAAQEAPEQEQQPEMMQRMMSQMQARRQEMMGERQALVDALSASTERLDQLVETMETAPGQARIDAIAAVVTELAAGQRSLLALVEAQPAMMQQMHMMQMMGMMQQMMGNMEMGGEAGQ